VASPSLPTDLGLIIGNLTSFYDFRAKSVLHAGAGGGQLLGYADRARKVVAVDKDPDGLRRLEAAVSAQGLEKTVAVTAGDFYDLDLKADVVLLEFCLHEMRDPRRAIDHARAAAPDVVVIDHLPASPWAWYANEGELMARAWKAIEASGARRTQSYEAVQRFDDHRALRKRFSDLGEESHRRIAAFDGQTGIAIPMPYGIALL